MIVWIRTNINWTLEEESCNDCEKKSGACGAGLAEGLGALCDEQVKGGENNTLVIKVNLARYNFRGGLEFTEITLKANEKEANVPLHYVGHIYANYLKKCLYMEMSMCRLLPASKHYE